MHAANKDYDLAAKILAKINLENAHRTVDADEKASVYVTIAEYWFDNDGDAVNAETYINKAAHIMHHVKDAAVQLRYKVCHARIMDSKRRFLVAAQSYYDLSNQDGVDPADLLQLLGMSVTCALLAPSGPQKARILANLHKDVRS